MTFVMHSVLFDRVEQYYKWLLFVSFVTFYTN